MKNYMDVLSLLKARHFITTYELNQNKINSREIKELVDNGVLIRLNRGFYQIEFPKEIYDKKLSTLDMAKKMINEGKFEEAEKKLNLYLKHRLCPKALFYLFKLYVMEKKYELAYETLLKCQSIDRNEDDNKYSIYFNLLEQLILEQNNKRKVKK